MTLVPKIASNMATAMLEVAASFATRLLPGVHVRQAGVSSH